MIKKNDLLRSGLVFIVLFGLTFFSSSCSQQETTTSSGAESYASRITVWAKDFAPGQLEAHYIKHKHEFGDISKEQYLSRARILLNSAPGKDILEKRRDNGDVLHYRVGSGEFAVMTFEGRIRTYFKSDYRYWSRQ